MNGVNNVTTTAMAAQTNAYQTTKKEQETKKDKEIKSDEYAGSKTTNKTGMYNKNGVKVDYDALAAAKAEMKNNAVTFKAMVEGAKNHNTHSLNSKDANYWGKWVHSQLGKQYGVFEAKSLVADDGYWSVEQTSQRIVDFAKGLAGDDMAQYDKLLGAIEKGFGSAKASWGGKMPDITSQTYNAVMEKMAAWKSDVEGTKKAAEAINKPKGEAAGFVDYITGKLNGDLDNAKEIIDGLKNAVTLDGSVDDTGTLDERFIRREAALKIAEYISQNYMNKEDGAYFMNEMKKLAGETEKREIALGHSNNFASYDDYVNGNEQPVDALLDKWKKSDFIAAFSDWDMDSVLKSFSKPSGMIFDDVMSQLMSETVEKVSPYQEGSSAAPDIKTDANGNLSREVGKTPAKRKSLSDYQYALLEGMATSRKDLRERLEQLNKQGQSPANKTGSGEEGKETEKRKVLSDYQYKLLDSMEASRKDIKMWLKHLNHHNDKR